MTLKTLPKKPFKYNCPNCGYGTNRKWSFEYHTNRKVPCKPKETESRESANVINIGGNVNNVNNIGFSDIEHVNNGVNNVNISKSNAKKKFVCEKCGKNFSSRQSKSFHKKSCKAVAPLAISERVEDECDKVDRCHVKKAQCKPPDSRADNVDQLKAKIHELEAALHKKGQVVHNTYNITNNDNSMINNTSNTNNVIHLNNFDSPSLSHITPQMIGEMYLKSDRELPRMIGHAVRKIYKEVPENDCIRIKYGNQAGFAEVRQDDETRILPVSDVLDTVLSQTSTLCGKELQKCCGPNMIPGPSVVNDAQELSVLHWGFVPETHAKRQGFFKYVKSALL